MHKGMYFKRLFFINGMHNMYFKNWNISGTDSTIEFMNLIRSFSRVYFSNL